jgi:hypothetical protein
MNPFRTTLAATPITAPWSIDTSFVSREMMCPAFSREK